MSKIITSPLMADDLKAAAHLCLHASAYTDLDQFPPGSGDKYRRDHRARKSRFEEALKMTKKGVTSLLELGLSHKDCSWAAGQVGLIKEKIKEGWLSRFQTAETALKQVEEIRLAEIEASISEESKTPKS